MKECPKSLDEITENDSYNELLELAKTQNHLIPIYERSNPFAMRRLYCYVLGWTNIAVSTNSKEVVEFYHDNVINRYITRKSVKLR